MGARESTAAEALPGLGDHAVSDFTQRNKPHGAHLQATRRALEARGFTVENTGFETLSDVEPRAARRGWPGELRRWWPDLLARRGPFGRMWVDAKACVRDDTDNYSIELAALACYGFIEGRMRQAVVLVWPGGWCNYSSSLTPIYVQTRGDTEGSDTAFALVRKVDQRKFDDVFGPAEKMALAS